LIGLKIKEIAEMIKD